MDEQLFEGDTLATPISLSNFSWEQSTLITLNNRTYYTQFVKFCEVFRIGDCVLIDPSINNFNLARLISLFSDGTNNKAVVKYFKQNNQDTNEVYSTNQSEEIPCESIVKKGYVVNEIQYRHELYNLPKDSIYFCRLKYDINTKLFSPLSDSDHRSKLLVAEKNIAKETEDVYPTTTKLKTPPISPNSSYNNGPNSPLSTSKGTPPLCDVASPDSHTKKRKRDISNSVDSLDIRTSSPPAPPKRRRTRDEDSVCNLNSFVVPGFERIKIKTIQATELATPSWKLIDSYDDADGEDMEICIDEDDSSDEDTDDEYYMQLHDATHKIIKQKYSTIIDKLKLKKKNKMK